MRPPSCVPHITGGTSGRSAYPLFRALLVGLSVVGAPLAACTPALPPPRPLTVDLPLYDSQGVELFDDVIEPAAAGLDADLEGDRKQNIVFIERTRKADDIVRVRLGTVSPTFLNGNRAFEVTMVPVSRLGNRSGLPEKETFFFEKNSPSFLVAEGLGGKLAGMTFVAFYKRFRHADGSTHLHFHLSPDKPEVLEAVEAVRTP